MVLSIIALILSLAAFAYSVFVANEYVKNVVRLDERVKRTYDQYKTMMDTMEMIAKSRATSIKSLEGVKYDPKTTSLTVEGNLLVKGSVAAGGISVKE